jgi:Ca2+:H+ antiporter
VYITNQSISLENANPPPQLQLTIMTPSKAEPTSDDGSKKAEPASGGSSDTIRQVAPDSRPGYGNGLLNTYLPTLSDYNPTVGTMTSSNPPAPEPRGHDFALDGQRQSRRLSDSSSGHRHTQSPPPMAPGSPQTTKVPKKPANIRRTSTRTPHRGEEFSVDDDPDEVEEERVRPPPHQPSFPPLNRQPTIRRKPAQLPPTLPRVDSQDEEDDVDKTAKPPPTDSLHTDEVDEADEREAETTNVEDAELSDAESFTLKDKQLAINETHPFGIRIWKPALYKKDRSVEKTAEEDIHSSPSAIVSNWLWIFNGLWTVLFGWWLALAALLAAAVCFIFGFEPSARKYSRVLRGLSRYLLYPFGQFVKLESDEIYAEEDEGEGRSISEYEQWQRGDLEYGRLMFGPTLTHTGSIVGRRRSSIDSASEQDSLLGRTGRGDRTETGLSTTKRRFFGRGQWTLGRVIFFIFFYFLIAPLLLLVSGICWLMVFSIPMGRVTSILFYHLRRHPLALTFHNDATFARSSTRPSSILLCTYRAVGLKYWKYTVDGTNIFLINFLGIVVLVILDYFILDAALGIDIWLTSPSLLFPLALISIIPLAYFIGQAVASISAQSSMGMGAAVNAFFSTVVEVYLYCIALNEGKGKLVEGSLVGSIFAGVLLLPGLSMCFGAIKRKTQRFNVKSQSATLTMLLFAIIAAFGPTLFYKIYGAVSKNPPVTPGPSVASSS